MYITKKEVAKLNTSSNLINEVKNEEDLRVAAAVLNNRMIGLCNSKNLEDTHQLFEEICSVLSCVYMYKVKSNEKNS